MDMEKNEVYVLFIPRLVPPAKQIQGNGRRRTPDIYIPALAFWATWNVERATWLLIQRSTSTTAVLGVGVETWKGNFAVLCSPMSKDGSRGA